ncbi:MAG: MipA/OmpV family protein [Pseudomonadota bacterium]
MTNRFAFIGLIACFLLNSIAIAQANEKSQEGWQYDVSAGFLYLPTFLGDDDYQFSVFPNLSVRYDDKFTASFAGVEYVALDLESFRAGPVIRYNFGRDEQGSNPLALGDDSTDLVGLGDVDGAVELGGFVQYVYENFSATVEVRHAIGGHDGLVGDMQVKYTDSFKAFGKTLIYSVGPEASFGSDSFNSAFFDVDSAQSLATGISEYDTEGGLNSIGFGASIIANLTNHVSLIGFGGYDRLLGDVADSSLVEERGSENQGVFGFALNYRF